MATAVSADYIFDKWNSLTHDIFFDFPFLIHSQRIVVNGHYFIYKTVDVTRSGTYVFNYYVVSLSKF